jgi:single-stranded DNA-binding protein
MTGITAQFSGTLTRSAEVRTTRGARWLAFNVSVDGQYSTVRCSVFHDLVDDARELTKGTEVYCEGQLSLRSWQDGLTRRMGLSCAVTKVEIGRSP